MSEFKFACPVCGQHITADESTSGGQIDCPTCFQKIVVPQAPTSTETKFILSAAQVAKPRPVSPELASGLTPLPSPPSRSAIPAVAVLLVVLCAAGAGLYVFRDRIFKPSRGTALPGTEAPAPPSNTSAALNTTYPVPTNIAWTLDLTKAEFPETAAAGRIHGSGFVSERTTVQGGTFSLRQGKGWPPDLAVALLLAVRRGEELGGRFVTVNPDQPSAPQVFLRWKDAQHNPKSLNLSQGYALKLIFGQPANDRLPGKIYLCLPDEERSFVAGTFEAEILKPEPQKATPRKRPRPKG